MWRARKQQRKVYRAGAGGRELGTRIVTCPYDGKPIEVPAYVGDWVSQQIARGNLEEVHREAETIVSRLLRKVMAQGLSIAPFQHERVQSSIKHAGVPDHVLDALSELDRMAAMLGRMNYNLLKAVIIDGLNASTISSVVMGERAFYNRKEAAKQLRFALDQVAEMYGLKQNHRPRLQSVVEERPALLPPGDPE